MKTKHIQRSSEIRPTSRQQNVAEKVVLLVNGLNCSTLQYNCLVWFTFYTKLTNTCTLNTTDLVNGWLMMERRLTGFSSVNVRHGMSLNGSYTICFGCLGCLSLWLAASIFLTCWGKKHISIISPNVLWFNNCITFTRHKHHQHLYLPAVRSHGMVK